MRLPWIICAIFITSVVANPIQAFGFDVGWPGGRNAIVSFRTLLGIEDHYSPHYSDMAKGIRFYSLTLIIWTYKPAILTHSS